MSDPIQQGLDPNTGNPPSALPMNSLPSNQGNIYLGLRAYWQNEMIVLQSLVSALSGSDLDEYEVRSGDGMRKGKRKDLNKMIQALETATDNFVRYHQKLYGRGLMTMRMRRS